jgi:hypothetical protein
MPGSPAQGDNHPGVFIRSRELSEIYCTKFNLNNPDSGAVYYQSYGAKMKYAYGDPAFIIMQPL